MGSFKNTTLGLGVLSLNGVDVGFLKGNVKLEVKADVLPFEYGVPLLFQGQVITKETVSLTASAAEISVPNLLIAMGRGTLVDNTGSSPVTVTAQEVAFAPPATGGLQQIVLSGPNVASLVVKDHAALGTTYTSGTDYLLDALRGILYRNPSGAITSLEDMSLSYTWTAPLSTQINFGHDFILNQVMLDFVHTSPVSGNVHQIKFWKCQSNGTLSQDYSESAYQLLNMEFKSLPDNTHTANPTGYELIVPGP